MLREIWENERPAGATVAVAALLGLLALPYGAVVALRNRLYDRGLLPQGELPCPVVSVGNLTVGGTGKTPTVILMARILRERGWRPAVLSRGYGGSAREPVNVVSDGKRVVLGWSEAGDEPVLIARTLPEVPVLTGTMRLLTGRAAVEKFGANVLILDDAFQHRSLRRSLDVVLIDAARPFGNGSMLPRGPLREKPEGLRRAHVIIRTGAEENAMEPTPGLFGLPCFRGYRRAEALVGAGTGQVFPVEDIRGRKGCAFAGIGRPDSFRESLAGLGAQVVSFRPFDDHHPYGPGDLDDLLRLAAASGAGLIVTTEKDAVRLADFPDFLAELFFLRIGMEITPAEAFAGLLFTGLRIK